jgi:hypothetical protein
MDSIRETVAWYGENTSELVGRYVSRVLRMIGKFEAKVKSKQ